MSEMQGRLIFKKDREAGVTAYDRKKDEAWQNYVETAQQRGEEDILTKLKLFIFMMRWYMGEIKQFVGTTKELINEIGAISNEVDSLVEMDVGSTERFTYGIEKWPRFMRGFIMKRRAKRYYQDKMTELQSKIEIAMNSMHAVPEVLQGLMSGFGGFMNKMTKSFNLPGTSGKGGTGMLPPAMIADMERRRAAAAGGGAGAPAGGGASAGGSAPVSGGASGGSAPAQAPSNGSSSGSAGDHWDDDLM